MSAEEVKGLTCFNRSDATCVWSNVRSDLLNKSGGNRRRQLDNTEEQNTLPGGYMNGDFKTST